MNSISLFLLYVTLFVSFIKSTPLEGEYVGSYKYTNFTIEEIKDMEIISCKDDSECPDYSKGCELFTRFSENGEDDLEFKLCDMNFICHKNDTCLSLSNASTYYINMKGMEYGISFVSNKTIEEGEIEQQDKLILHSCDTQMYKHNLCDTEACETTENCYSGSCIHQTCMVNSENPSYMCRIDWLIEEEKPAMLCKLANGEKCSENNDCDHINVCDERYDICASPLIAENHGDNGFPDYLFIGGVAVTIIIVLIFVGVITLFVMSCIYVAIDDLKSILFNIDDYRQLEMTTFNH
jgi:hypothetical protein